MNISTASLTTERKWRSATGYDEKRLRVCFGIWRLWIKV